MPSRTGSSPISPGLSIPLRALATRGLQLLAAVLLLATVLLVPQPGGTDTAGGRWERDGGRWGSDRGGESRDA